MTKLFSGPELPHTGYACGEEHVDNGDDTNQQYRQIPDETHAITGPETCESATHCFQTDDKC
ncbi:MAG: hypothetical protein KDJ38_01625 [Gammaproteobacteria bacterium]|nr:hypothetical protein [Gammaproteobacteria bacterium]